MTSPPRGMRNIAMSMSVCLIAVASPGSEGRGCNRVGGLELCPQQDAEPPLPRLGVSNIGVNGKLLHPERLSPFPSLHLSFPSPFLSSLPSPLQVVTSLRLGSLGERLTSPNGSGRSPAAKRLLLHFQRICIQLLPREAMLSAVYAVVVCLCVCHTPVLYQNG